jgi:hypothetical protein
MYKGRNKQMNKIILFFKLIGQPWEKTNKIIMTHYKSFPRYYTSKQWGDSTTVLKITHRKQMKELGW